MKKREDDKIMGHDAIGFFILNIRVLFQRVSGKSRTTSFFGSVRVLYFA
jgi:hypothetical protein